MSSGQNKRVNSIAKKLSSFVKRKKLRLLGLVNLILVIACMAVYVLTLEYAACGALWEGNYRTVELNRDARTQLRSEVRRTLDNAGDSGIGRTKFGRYAVKADALLDYYIHNSDKVDNLVTYQSYCYVSDGHGNYAKSIDYRHSIMIELLVCLMALIAVRILERIWCWIASGFERRKIRRVLRPIDEIAAKADELTRMEFDETKFHNLEEKIAELDPEDSLPVTQGDKDLESLENAINNLLMRMRESNRQQARFVNDASHELRTPIAVIEGYANMLARWGREDEKVLDESIQAIQHESSHMKYLVEQLLFLARGDSGKTVLKPEDISISDMMREIYEESLMIDEKHIYKFDCPEDTDIRFTCDPALVKQAVRILVDNAAKYTNEKDEIILAVGTEESGHPFLQVEDTGIGMAESDVAHMFERFYRSDEVRSYQGTGLGLSIAKWIIDKHNGHFEVTSREGIGTRIRVVL